MLNWLHAVLHSHLTRVDFWDFVIYRYKMQELISSELDAAVKSNSL